MPIQAEILNDLRDAAEHRRETRRQLAEVELAIAYHARAAGLSWAETGALLGISKQAAHNRYSSLLA